MTEKLTKEQAQNKVKEVFNNRFNGYEDYIKFNKTVETENIYFWHFELKDKRYKIVCNKNSSEVMIFTYNR